MRIAKNKTENSIQYDSLKINYLAKFIEEIGESQIVFVHSPIWYGLDTAWLQPLKELCVKHNISFFDYSNDSEFVHHNDLFKDGLHLNAKGADVFTAKFVDDLEKKAFLRDLCKNSEVLSLFILIECEVLCRECAPCAVGSALNGAKILSKSPILSLCDKIKFVIFCLQNYKRKTYVKLHFLWQDSFDYWRYGQFRQCRAQPLPPDGHW
jgi:hypothetical protein